MKLLTKKYEGFRISAANALHYKGFRVKMSEHLNEMATRYYNGDITAVDEFCQIYCLAEKQRERHEEDGKNN